jgi:leader peptidase (prepilin peptidase)/N-methyltransferase
LRNAFSKTEHCRVLDFVTALWLGFIGACVGSFLNVVAYRMPRGMSVVWKPSHCPKCGRAIRPRDNVPVLGWLWLRGRCRDCGQPISPRYAIVEAAMGAAFLLLAYRELFTAGANLPGGPFGDVASALYTVWNPNWGLIRVYAYHAILLSALMTMALIDQDRQRLPLKLPLTILAFAFICAWQWRHLYFERAPGFFRVPEIKAPVDAVLGATWAAAPWIIAAGYQRLRKQQPSERLINLACAAAVVGAFVGLRAMVRISLIWLISFTVVYLFKRRSRAAISPILALWIATALHLLLWKQLAATFTW